MSEYPIKLEGNVTIGKAERLHQQLQEALQTGQPVVIDAREIARIDTAVLQLLLAFNDSVKTAGFSLRWDGASEELVAGARLLGLEQHLGLV